MAGWLGGYFTPQGSPTSIASGAVVSGNLAAGSVTSGTLASGAISRFAVASGSFLGFELGSGAIVSGRIASGQIGFGHLANAAVQSGTLGSGQVSAWHVASGDQAGYAQEAGGAPSVSGTTPAIPQIVHITAEIISGGRAVTLNTSGQLIIAMAGLSGRIPAIGITDATSGNALSGLTLAWSILGGNQWTSGMYDYSGFLGRRVYLGRSGQVLPISGSWGSGGWLSGDIGQALGYTANSGAVWFNVAPVCWSGGPLALAPGSFPA